MLWPSKSIHIRNKCVKTYLQNQIIEHIPVVGSELTKDFESKFEIMTKNTKYCNLIANLMSLEEEYGFQFLNSEQCDELFEKIITLEKLIIKNNDDIILSRIFQLGKETIDTYENEIIKNIYNYSAENKYNTALMFIGAAHRKSIMQKIHEYEKIDKLKLNWKLYENKSYNKADREQNINNILQ